MRRSAEAFDNGHQEEAERLASSVYIICHDGGRQKSLLEQLGLKTGLTFTDSSTKQPDDPWKMSMGPPLAAMKKIEGGIVYVAPLGERGSVPVKFSKRWEQIVYSNESGKSISRKNLVFFLRSQDGGGHVDDHIRDEQHHRFSRYADHVTWNKNFSIYGQILLNNDQNNLHWLTMRQIAWEVDEALKSLGF